jgi:hypothetical protein
MYLETLKYFNSIDGYTTLIYSHLASKQRLALGGFPAVKSGSQPGGFLPDYARQDIAHTEGFIPQISNALMAGKLVII